MKNWIQLANHRDAKLGFSMVMAFLSLIFAFGCKPEPENIPKEKEPIDSNRVQLDFITGMDLSYQPLLVDRGTVFENEAGESIDDLVAYVQSQGVNLIRLRLFHTPEESDPVMAASQLDEVIDLAQQVVASGNDWLLDIHYSDTWADPGNQTVPAAWQGLSPDLLSDSVADYTRRVMERLAAANILPQIVQIGNETNDGFLWEQGRAWGNFVQYASLVKAGLAAVKEVEKQASKPIYSMIHLSGIMGRGDFFDQLLAQGADFDLIGLSHYSRWHSKDLNQVSAELNALAEGFEKPILIVETAYPWTLDWHDWTNNIVGGNDHLVNGYPATPAGQAAYLAKWVEVLKAVPEGRGLGFVWWAPDYVAFDGPQSNHGSPWENMTTFDFDNRALPVMQVFRDH